MSYNENPETLVRCEDEEVFLTFTRKGCSWSEVASQAITDMSEEASQEADEIEEGLGSTVTWIHCSGFGRRDFVLVGGRTPLWLNDPDFGGGWNGLREGDVNWVLFGSGSSSSTITAWVEEDGTWTMQFQAPVSLYVEEPDPTVPKWDQKKKVLAVPYAGNYWDCFFGQEHPLYTH